MHREVEQKDVAYALRERHEADNANFGGKSEPLTVEMERNTAVRRPSVVR
jgi:hypothetical protein